jgi:hypothetical protein
MTTEKKQPTKGGRKPKENPSVFRYSVNFTESENADFLARFEQSGAKNKSQFIVSALFNRSFKVVKIDKAAMDYYMRLTTFHSQFRAIGVNYNQAVKALKSTFTEKKALAFLYKLEKATRELVEINQKIIELTEEFEQKYLQNNSPQSLNSSQSP